MKMLRVRIFRRLFLYSEIVTLLHNKIYILMVFCDISYYQIIGRGRLRMVEGPGGTAIMTVKRRLFMKLLADKLDPHSK